MSAEAAVLIVLSYKTNRSFLIKIEKNTTLDNHLDYVVEEENTIEFSFSGDTTSASVCSSSLFTSKTYKIESQRNGQLHIYHVLLMTFLIISRHRWIWIQILLNT